MVEGAKIGGGVGKVRQRPTEAQAEIAKKQNEILSHLGMKSPTELGGGAQDMLRGILEGNLNRPEVLDAKDIAKRLRSAHADDLAAQFSTDIRVPGSLKVAANPAPTKEHGDRRGRFQLQGELSREDHPVRQLLGQLEINPKSMGPAAAAEIEKLRGQDLGDPGTLDGLAKGLARAKVLDTPLGKLGALGGAAKIGATGASAVETDSGSVGLGLDKTARKTGEKGATVSPEAVMTSQKVKDPGLEGRRKEAVAELGTILGEAGLSDKQVAELEPLLDKALRGGQLSKNPVDRAWAIHRNAQLQATGKAPPDDKATTDSEALHTAASAVAALSLFNLAETKGGAPLDSSRLEDAQAVIMRYTQGGRTKTSGRATAAAAKSAAKTASSEAQRFAASIGLDPSSPASAHTFKDVEKAFQKVLGNGKKADADVVRDALKHINRETGGVERPFAQHVETILSTEPKSDPKAEAQLREAVLQKLALCAALGPEGYKQHHAQAIAAAGAAGPPMGPGGPFPNMGFGGPLFDQFGVTNPIARQAMGASILYDPALSHEDKITLFLLLMSKFMDQDRLRKMQELAELDAKDAAKSGAKAKTPTTSVPGASGASPDKTKSASKAGKGAKGGGESQTGTAETRQAQGSGKTPRQEKPGEPGKEAKAPSDPTGGSPIPPQAQGNQDPRLAADPSVTGETPKARDTLMMQLDRIGKMRDNLFEIVQSILRQMAENTKNVWRG